jgi:hypothetical protein
VSERAKHEEVTWAERKEASATDQGNRSVFIVALAERTDAACKWVVAALNLLCLAKLSGPRRAPRCEREPAAGAACPDSTNA